MSDLKFLHMGDLHIGKERLGGRLPSSDFADAFDRIADVAVRERVDFALVAGDFFDMARIEPPHLAEAERALERFRNAGIPLVAIEGNHDVVSSYEAKPSWLSYLNQVGLVRLLRTEFRDGQPRMREWTEKDRRGNWMDLKETRIYGAGWFGASTARRLELLAPHLEKQGPTILMLHAGINGMAEENGMLDVEQLELIKDAVDVVALGHMHKMYSLDGFAYNAGAPENWDLDEERYGTEKGYWIYSVTNGRIRATHGTVKRRPVHLDELSADGCSSFEDILDKLKRKAKKWKLDPEAAVRLRLSGRPTFHLAGLDLRAMERVIEETACCRAAEVIPALGHPKGASGAASAVEVPREVIEREEIEKLIEETGRYPDDAEIVAKLVGLVLRARTSEDLYGEMYSKAAPLLEDIDEAS